MPHSAADPRPADAPATVLVLGPVAVRHGEAVCGPSSPVLRAVLAGLALARPHGLASDALFELVWGTRNARSVEPTVSVTVHRLRRWLRQVCGELITVARASGRYRLVVSDGQVDAELFGLLTARARRLTDPVDREQTLARALGCWRGSALADVVPDSVNHTAVEALERERTRTTVDYVHALLACGRAEPAAQVSARLAADHPLDERVLTAHIEALAAAGRRAEALDCYEQLRIRLRDELGIDPDRRVGDALVRVLRQDAGGRPPPAAVLVPAELPPPVEAFVGRREQLDALEGLLAGGHRTMVVSALSGTGGVGKTSLAVRWARQVACRFPDGQLFVDLRGYAQGPPLRPAEVLNRFLRSLGVPAPVAPLDLAEATGRYRSALAGRRVLVVLDNAADEQQVRPLLPGEPGCMALITSRSRLDGLVAVDGAHRISLDVLPAADAAGLLTRILGADRTGAEPAAAAALASACAFLPLALRICAASLLAEPDRSIAGLVDELRRSALDALALGSDERSSVRATLDLSYRRLSAPDRRVFRLLGTVPGPDITVAAVAALTGSSRDDAYRALARLTAAHLLTGRAHRYQYHDLLRAYAEEQADREETPEDRERAWRRLAHWYRDRTDAAVARVDPHLPQLPARVRASPAADPEFGSHDEAARFLAAERHNLVAVATRAAAHGPYPVAWQLAHAARQFFAHSGTGAERMALAQAAVAAAGRADDPFGAAVAERALAHAQERAGDYVAAVRHNRRSLERARRAGWEAHSTDMLGALGTVYALAGRNRRAIRLLEEAAADAHRTGNRRGEATYLSNLAVTLGWTGELAEALDCTLRALAIYRELELVSCEAIGIGTLGEAHYRMGSYRQATDAYTEAIELARTAANPTAEISAYNGIAWVYLERGRHAEAEACASAALAMAEKLGAYRQIVTAETTLAAVDRQLGRHGRAVDRLLSALAQATGGDVETRTRALLGLALAVHRRRPGDALAHAQEALAISHRAGFRLIEGQALVTLAELHLARDRPGHARHHSQRALDLLRGTGHVFGEARAWQVLGEAFDRDGDAAGARAARNRAHQIFTDLDTPEAVRRLS